MRRVAVVRGADNAARVQHEDTNSVLEGLPDMVRLGRELPMVALPAGTTDVPHGMGRKYSGWFLTRYIGLVLGSEVLEAPVQPHPTTHLRLTSTLDRTVSIWIW